MHNAPNAAVTVQATVLRAACLSLVSSKRATDPMCTEEMTAGPCVPGSAAARMCEQGDNAREHRTSCIAGGPIANGTSACKCSAGYVNPAGDVGALEADAECVLVSDPCLRDGSCEGSSGVNTAAVAGGVAAVAAVLLAIVVAALWCCCRRRKRSQRGDEAAPKQESFEARWHDGLDGDEMQRAASRGDGKAEHAATAAHVYVAGATGGHEFQDDTSLHVVEQA